MNIHPLSAAPLALAAAVALAACTQSAKDADTSAATDTATAAATTATTEPATPSPTDAQSFVDAAAASDMFEIEAGKLAQANGTSQAVKDFGAMMERDHTRSSADLKAAAANAQGLGVKPGMTAKQQSDLTALRGAGDRFDALYKQQQLAAHQEALALLRAQADSGAVASLKAFAAKTAPVVERHLEHVQRLP